MNCTLKVMMIDDDPPMLEVLGKIVQATCHQLGISANVQTFADHNEAWAAFQGAVLPFDGVIVDSVLDSTKVRGEDVLRYMYPDEHVMSRRGAVATGLSDDGNLSRIRGLGVQYVINKTEMGKQGTQSRADLIAFLLNLKSLKDEIEL